MSYGLAEEINNKKGMEKKEAINYNICYTHSGHDVGCRLRLHYFSHAQIKKRKE